jgi:hypothetical protein
MWTLPKESGRIGDKNIILMMEAASTSEKLVNFYQTTRRNNPEDIHRENLKSQIIYTEKF